MTPSDTTNLLPEAAAAERLRQYLQEIASERDRAHRALQEREAELARIQRIAGVGGLEIDFRDGVKNRRSPEYLIVHGLPPEAANETYEEWVSRIHPEDRERTVQHLFGVLKSQSEDYSAEYRIVRPNDGAVRWIRVVAKIEREADGRALRLVGADCDVTDQMLAQATLRESEERFRLIANSAPVPIWVTKLDRTRSFANQAYVDFLGLPFEEAIVFDWRKRLHPDDAARVVQESIAGEASLKPFVLEARYKNAAGEWRWLRSESQPRWDPTGKHIGFIGVAHDVTSAKQAEHDLRRLNEILELRITERTAQLESSEAQMRAIFETSHQYQALLNQHGDVLYANRTALAGIRADAGAVVGQPFWETPWFAATPGMRDAVRDAFITVMQGEEVKIEMLLHLPIGDRYFDFAMRPLHDRHGTVIGAVPEAIDVTERRQGEEALRQSQKMEAVGQLTGGVAHDFNNLLTIIRSATDFLRRRELPEERRRRYIDAIAETVERASKLTGQLLAFARRQPLKPQVFNVGTQVESVAQLIRPLVGARIRIDVEIADLNCFAIADVAQFETALMNLAVNSRDAMDSEGRLTIQVRKVDAIPPLRAQPARSGDFVAVTVTDTGCGIAPALLETIFEPFFTTKEVGKGTGLGLALVYGIVTDSAGAIDVSSTVGQGSRFTIYLPRVEAPDVVDAENEAPMVRGNGERVMVVDDEQALVAMTSEVLKRLGYEPTACADGAAALAQFDSGPNGFDAVVTDEVMPGLTGTELASSLRRRRADLPVVLVSGYIGPMMSERAATAGISEILKKPVQSRELAAALARVLKRN
jgi:PAS domain S-box-containing protein